MRVKSVVKVSVTYRVHYITVFSARPATTRVGLAVSTAQAVTQALQWFHSFIANRTKLMIPRRYFHTSVLLQVDTILSL